MREMPKIYDAKSVDLKWYDFWKKGRFFEARPKSCKKPYALVMPPPNVTGVLHMGHALVSTLQDILIRWKRMQGFDTLWVPGTDHAGIATQTVVERHLIQTEGKRRKDYDRDEFLQHVWAWKEKREGAILGQIARLGCSCDWSRLAFTMDETRSRAVYTLFQRLFDQGLIYRGDYLVNWDPVTQTALADDEVEYEERASTLWTIRYPIEGSQETLCVATTRPETMLGDTAVAVSPKDARYQSLIGKHIKLPLTGRLIPVIEDPFVDPKFGTGAVKVTPAHDPIDYETAIRHSLPFINIMTPDGCINENGGAFVGLQMEEARQKVLATLKELGLIEKEEAIQNRIGFSYRSKAKIEPYLSKQWFIRMSGFKKTLRALVESGSTTLIPKNWESTYFHWIDNLRDWCISRQLWWGHRIPIWYRKDQPDTMICHGGHGLPPEVEKEPAAWRQDEDVLDTWFSSSLWPLSTLGWPDQTDDFKRYYPNSTLITGHDILFFWVARMLAIGTFCTDTPPFPEAFLHGLIYGKSYWREQKEGGINYLDDEERKNYDLGEPLPKDILFKWEKMSKSKGNIINPIEIIDEYGTDAVRMALAASSPQNREIDLDRRKFEEFRNFANKVWNGARFIFLNLFGTQPLTKEQFCAGIEENLLRLEDKWILAAVERTIADVNHALNQYTFDQAAMRAYEFFWNEFCSYYLEIAKPFLFKKMGTEKERTNKQRILFIVLLKAIRLLHPFAPFITEELFQAMKDALPELAAQKSDDHTLEAIHALKHAACIIAPYPKNASGPEDASIFQDFDHIRDVVYSVRNIRGEMSLPQAQATDLYIMNSSDALKNNVSILHALLKLHDIHFVKTEPQIPLSAVGQLGSIRLLVPLPEEFVEKERARLAKDKLKLEQSLERMRHQLANKSFLQKAPESLVQQQKEKMNLAASELALILKKLATIETNR